MAQCRPEARRLGLCRRGAAELTRRRGCWRDERDNGHEGLGWREDAARRTSPGDDVSTGRTGTLTLLGNDRSCGQAAGRRIRNIAASCEIARIPKYCLVSSTCLRARSPRKQRGAFSIVDAAQAAPANPAIGHSHRRSILTFFLRKQAGSMKCPSKDATGRRRKRSRSVTNMEDSVPPTASGRWRRTKARPPRSRSMPRLRPQLSSCSDSRSLRAPKPASRKAARGARDKCAMEPVDSFAIDYIIAFKATP